MNKYIERNTTLVTERLTQLFHALGAPTQFSPAILTSEQLADALGQLARLADKKKFGILGQVQICLLALTGTYHRRSDLEMFSTYAAQDDKSSLVKELLASDLYREALGSSRHIKLVSVPEGHFLFDVSHTIDYPYNSGIQRVVRRISQSLDAMDAPVTFFRVDSSSGQPSILSAADRARLLNFGRPSSRLTGSGKLIWLAREVAVATPKRLLRYLFDDAKHILKIYYHRLRDHYLSPWSMHFGFAKAIFNWIDRKKVGAKENLFALRKKVRAIRSNHASWVEVPILIGADLFEPEVPMEEARLEFFLSVRSSVANHLTLLVYDLIPLIVPEFCTVNEGFIHYAKLFRVADHSICISKAVADDLQNFRGIVLSQRTMKIEHLHLAGDFKIDPAKVDLQKFDSKRPRILCVGTFEPRKNQINVIRAAYLLKTKGYDFEMAFAGNPGWKNELFAAELRRLDPQQEFVRLYSRVSDEDLDALYKTARFSIFCSHAEGFGLPILESVQRGKPAIVSDRGSMSELADLYGGCVKVHPDDIQAIASAMESLLIDSVRYQNLTREIRVTSQRTWMEYSELLLEQFRSAAKKKSVSGENRLTSQNKLSDKATI